jgi:hypothetical protein
MDLHGPLFSLVGPSICIVDKIPSCDVLITHGPPLGRGDLTSSSIRAGCYDLLVQIQERIKPGVRVFVSFWNHFT